MMFFLARRLLKWVVVAAIIAVAAPQLGSAAVARAWQALPWAGDAATTVTGGAPAGGFDPCDEVTYQVYGTPGSAEVAEVREAVRKVERLSGVSFRFTGVTDSAPSPTGPRLADVVVGWVSPSQTDLLDGDVSGAAVVLLSDSNRERYVGAVVALNTEHADRFSPGFGPGMTRGALVLHELGHVVGLGHSNQRTDLMFPVVRPQGPASFSHAERAQLQAMPRCSR